MTNAIYKNRIAEIIYHLDNIARFEESAPALPKEIEFGYACGYSYGFTEAANLYIEVLERECGKVVGSEKYCNFVRGEFFAVIDSLNEMAEEANKQYHNEKAMQNRMIDYSWMND